MIKKIALFLVLSCISLSVFASNAECIRIRTNDVDLIYRVAGNGRLNQCYFGSALNYKSDLDAIQGGVEAYLTHGMEDYYEPAIRVLHNDGNPSLLLTYISHKQNIIAEGITKTEILLQDKEYPIEVKLIYVAYHKQNIIKTYTEILHKERKPITLYNYASSMLHFNSAKYYVTDFSGDWAKEGNMNESLLSFGKKVVDTKLGSRASMFVSPMFMLSLDDRIQEDNGEVILGTLGWTGNFRFTFEVDNNNRLRVISGINPYASEYALNPKEVFRTPEFIFTYSAKGKGEASRNFHDWARLYQLKDGMGDRLTLLNNWEATFFDFNEEKLTAIIKDASDLGVDMFLLDDGWFGNKYPRKGDFQGLGDWEETKTKLPNGIGHLIKESHKNGVKFGLWIEPEMVSPKSELYENHKDWVIHLPNRKEYTYRKQMVLDLSNPKVQDYVFGIVDNLLTKYPYIAYFKWDCNSPITNIYSPYLKDKQSHLYVEHVRGLYNILNRIAVKYPSLPMMLCSGGSGRCDYEALKYFTEFWTSDNTDPIERIFIQWGFSHFFPAKSMSAHVTNWNKDTSIKFRTDVALMGKLGFDIIFKDLSSPEQEFCVNAVANFNRLKPVIMEGDLYRLHSPYNSNHASSIYITKDKSNAVLFSFDISPRFGEYVQKLRCKGLNSEAMYLVKEINMMPNQKSSLPQNGKILSGEFLMSIGLDAFTRNRNYSRVVELIQQ